MIKSWDYLEMLSKAGIMRFLEQKLALEAPTERTVAHFKWAEKAFELQSRRINNRNEYDEIEKETTVNNDFWSKFN